MASFFPLLLFFDMRQKISSYILNRTSKRLSGFRGLETMASVVLRSPLHDMRQKISLHILNRTSRRLIGFRGLVTMASVVLRSPLHDMASFFPLLLFFDM